MPHLATILVLAATAAAFASADPAPPPLEPYAARPATVVRVIDGDTAILRIDLDYDVSTLQSIRLEGYNAPELHGPNPELAAAARARLGALLAGRPVWVRRSGPRSFSRYVGRVYYRDDAGRAVDVGDQLRREGYAVPQGD